MTGPHPAAVLGDPAALAGAEHGRLARDVRGLAGAGVSGLSFAAMQFYWSNYQESGLVDVVAALFSLLVMVALPEGLAAARRSSPTTAGRRRGGGRGDPAAAIRVVAVLKGWSPFLLASVFIFLAAQPAVARYLTFAALKRPMPGLHRAVLRMPPVVPDADARGRDRRPEPPRAARHGGLRSAACLAALLLGMRPAPDRADLRPNGRAR